MNCKTICLDMRKIMNFKATKINLKMRTLTYLFSDCEFVKNLKV